MSRLSDIECFYELIDVLDDRVGGKRLLRDFSNYRDWPMRGIYLFFEPGENRIDSGPLPVSSELAPMR